MDRLARLDAKLLWHPFTQQSEWIEDLRRHNLAIARGQGVYLYDSSGRRYLDGVSSLWANLHGHRHPALDRAIRNQLSRLAHSTFLGLTHEPGIRLAQELLKAAPRNLTRVFYSDNGATAVEVALKMAYQFHAQTSGQSKAEFLALENSYHGDTIGSVSVGGIALFHKKFRPLLFKTHFARSPDCAHCPHNEQLRARSERLSFSFYRYRGEDPKPGDQRKETGCRWECLGDVEKILRRRGRRIAGAVIEPIVQGAAGIQVMPPGYLKGFERLCRRFKVPLIADEVAVGFGRTGKMFACEHENVRPDFLCLAKGISGGYLPLAATLCTEKIYRAFLGRYDQFKTFFHGHTYTANPLACAAGLESLKIFSREKVLERVSKLSQALKRNLERWSDLPWAGRVRQAGLMAGVDLVRDRRSGQAFAPGVRFGRKVCLEARKFGILSRPLGDTLVILPPLAIREPELNRLVQGLKRSIRIAAQKIAHG